MRFNSFLILFLTVSTTQAEIFDGIYVQQTRDIENSDTEEARKYNDYYERNKITLIIKGDNLTISMFDGADPVTLPVTKCGRALIAADEDMYWVIYQKDKDNIYSTGVRFLRIGDASP